MGSERKRCSTHPSINNSSTFYFMSSATTFIIINTAYLGVSFTNFPDIGMLSPSPSNLERKPPSARSIFSYFGPPPSIEDPLFSISFRSIWLSVFSYLFYFHMAPRSSISHSISPLLSCRRNSALISCSCFCFF